MSLLSASDTSTIRDRQRATWDGVANGWRLWGAAFESGAVTVTARLLDLGGVAAGTRVLDVGSGTGEPALSAARVVGRSGRVVGVDLSPEMVAAARAATAGIGHVEFVVGDVATAALPPVSFDVALSRWALMFAADRVQLLRAIARALVPDGALAAAVWAAPERVPIISLAFRVISRHLDLAPPPPGPGPFTMCDADAVATEFEEAGFRAIEIQEQAVPFRLPSVDAFARFSRDVLPPAMRRLLQERCGSVDDRGVWDAFAAAAREYEVRSGEVRLPSTCLCIRALAGGAR